MTTQLDDHTDASATVRLDEGRPVGSYTVHVADGSLAGRACFVDAPDVDGERIFFHTEVAPEYSGRGLARRLVSEALADSIRQNLTVVPVCPLFAAHIKDHAAAFLADGGRFRQPTRDDLALVRRLTTELRQWPDARVTSTDANRPRRASR